MAALTITASAIVPDTASAGYATQTGIAAVTITAGQTVYILANGTVGLADANAASPAYTVRGISLHAALAGQPITYQTGGDLAFGAILLAGKVYVNGGTAAGDINPVADLTTGWYTSILGHGISTTVLRLGIVNTGIASA